jgi:hypothetical protein
MRPVSHSHNLGLSGGVMSPKLVPVDVHIFLAICHEKRRVHRSI